MYSAQHRAMKNSHSRSLNVFLILLLNKLKIYVKKCRSTTQKNGHAVKIDLVLGALLKLIYELKNCVTHLLRAMVQLDKTIKFEDYLRDEQLQYR